MRFLNIVYILLVNTLLLAGCQNTATSKKTSSSVEQVSYFSNGGLSNPVSSTQHPAGEYVNGVTYVTYQGVLEDPYVAAYNHKTQRWSGPFKAGISDMGKDPTRKIDNHGKPALIVDDKGYIHLVFGGHGGMKTLGKNTLGNYHYGRQIHVVSKRPYDITEWEELDNVSPFGTYNQWIKMDNGDMYLFYRHGAHRSDWVYQKSTDHGRTFSDPVSVLKTARRNDVKATDGWYGWFGKATNDKIILSYSYHICWDTNKNHKHTGERLNGYYMQMDTKTGQWSNVQGQPLATPIGRVASNQKTLVLNSGKEWSDHGSTQLDQNGYPHVTFAKGPSLGRKHGGPKYPNYYRWNGQKWLVGNDGELPLSKGDLMVHSAMEVSKLLAAKNKSGDAEISWWHSKNGGQNFEQGEILFSRKKTGVAITSFIRNAHPDAQVIVSSKKKGTHLRNMYLIGDNGPIPRPKIEADVATEESKKQYSTSNK